MIMLKPTDMSKTALATHQGCMDGSGCTIMFLRAGGKLENVHFVAAGMVERFIKRDLPSLGDKFVIFADIGLNKKDGEKYAQELEKRGDCVLIDHHITSAHLKDKPWCDVRQEFCGTELLRQYLGLEDDSSKALAALIQDHDLWLRRDERSIELAAFTVFVGQDIFVERFKDRDVSKEFFTPMEQEMMKIMSRRRDQFIAAAIRKVVIKDVQWGESGDKLAKVGYIISPEMNVSLLLDTLLMEHTELDVGCQINLEKGSVSLRSRRGYDVSEMAAFYGGGGHKAASGHRIPEQITQQLIEGIHG